MSDNNLIRSIHYKYRIQGYANHFFLTGVTSDNHQVMIVVQAPCFVILFFDSNGNYQTMEERPLSVATRARIEKDGIREGLGAECDEELLAWMQAMHFEERTIEVKRFFLPNKRIGILDLPEFFRDVLERPADYSEDEQRIAQNERRRWIEDGVFELRLSNAAPLWIKKDGQLESS